MCFLLLFRVLKGDLDDPQAADLIRTMCALLNWLVGLIDPRPGPDDCCCLAARRVAYYSLTRPAAAPKAAFGKHSNIHAPFFPLFPYVSLPSPFALPLPLLAACCCLLLAACCLVSVVI